MTAWRGSIPIRADNDSLFEPCVQIPSDMNILHLPVPLYRVHLTYYNEAMVKRKQQFYKEVHDLYFPHPDVRFKTKEMLPVDCVWNGNEELEKCWGNTFTQNLFNKLRYEASMATMTNLPKGWMK